MEVCTEAAPVQVLQCEESVDWKEITELLENSKKLVEKLQEDVAGMIKLKERYNYLECKLADLQEGRHAIARNVSDTKIILERITTLEEEQTTNKKNK